MTPVFFAASSELHDGSMYVSVSVGQLSIYVHHPRLDGVELPFEFGRTALTVSGDGRVQPAQGDVAILLINQVGDMAICCGESGGTAFIGAWSGSELNLSNDRSAPLAPEWKILAMRDGVVFTSKQHDTSS